MRSRRRGLPSAAASETRPVLQSHDDLGRTERGDLGGEAAVAGEVGLEVAAGAELEDEQQLVVGLERALQRREEAETVRRWKSRWWWWWSR